ncbi:ERV/ALR sulfhydryl oxidase domain-containing protein [Xylogone sp. PMI_703]|nr:ERV/ALR sulfhydryl oxidase domain-containing protein [Xylogone sp. PMI_703]
MTDDTKEQDSNTTISPSGSSVAEPPKKFPKGVVLGKDGKPCRSCTSFASWAAQAKQTTKGTSTAIPPKDCPPDVEQLGRASWTLLHSISASYPERPTLEEQSNVKQFMGLFGKLYPCWVCAEDFQAYMEREKIRAGSRDEFGRWLCEAHNDVNRKLGKKEFDCNKWEERWRTGWKDGRCD